ncbi:hypothetical protein L0F63_001793 [Massospora cicadina]|nr:hypothetical protein L0F63_001793 [Massospora cicadina]
MKEGLMALEFCDESMDEAVMQLASFINFCPFKGYFDLSFTCEADIATVATVPLLF